MIRSLDAGMTLAELEVMAEDVLRFEIHPLIGRLMASGSANNPSLVREYFESQLDFSLLQLEQARAAVERQQDAYAMLAGDARPIDADSAGAASVVPQLTEGFVDRLVELARAAEDLTFRRVLINDLRLASLRTVPYQVAADYYQRLIPRLEATSWVNRLDEEEMARERQELLAIMERLVFVGDEMESIFELVSRNLNSKNQLYSQTAPAISVTERAYGLSSILALGVVLLLLSLPMLALAALLRQRLKTEESGL